VDTNRIPDLPCGHPDRHPDSRAVVPPRPVAEGSPFLPQILGISAAVRAHYFAS